MLLTFALTVLVDLTVAIGVGVTLASLLFMARMSDTVSIGQAGEDDADAEAGEQRIALPEGVEVFRIAGPFFFGVAAGLMDAYRNLSSVPRVLILRLEDVPMLDASGVAAVSELADRAGRSQTAIILCGAGNQPSAMLARADIGGDGIRLTYAPDYAAARLSALGLVRPLPPAADRLASSRTS